MGVAEPHDHLVVEEYASVGIDGGRGVSSVFQSPSVGCEVEGVKLVGVLHELYDASEEVHLVVVVNGGVGVSFAGFLSFLGDCFPFTSLERVAEEVFEEVGGAVVVPSVDVEAELDAGYLLWCRQEEWQDRRFMVVEGVFIYCHSKFYID